jgi:hypothetical protein
MTATEKNNIYYEGYNMFDENIFGCLIDKKSTKWAIENNKITDYRVICIKNSSIELDKISNNINIKKLIKLYKLEINNKKELFFAAYSTLKMISDNISNHLLVYTNNCDSAILIELIIDDLLKNNIFDNLNENDIYNKCLTSKIDINLEDEIKEFKNHKYGIIPCVYIFGEGVDIPKLDSIVIAEKMNTEIRITQSCLRPNRINKENPDKIAKIIIPQNDSTIDEKLKIIINKLANEDDIIEQKIELLELTDIKKISNNFINNYEIKLKPNKDLLDKIIYDLYKSGTFGKELTLEKEYQLYRELVLTKQFKSVKEYQDSDMIYNQPNVYFNGVWTNWFDFLNIDTSKWINNLQSWKEYCHEKNITSSSKYYENLDEKMPPEPEYFYPNFKGIDNELGKKKRKYIKNNSEYLFL